MIIESLKSKEIIYNFIEKSHFSAGFYVAFYLHEKGLLNKDSIKEVKDLNKSNDPPILKKGFNFELIAVEEIFDHAVNVYNKEYENIFKIKEAFDQEGQDFFIVNISNGSIIDIFCLGICMLLVQIK